MLLVLDTTSRVLRAKMASAPSSLQCSVTVTYADTTATTFTEGMYPIQLNGTSFVTILPAPAAGTKRVVKSVMFFNDDMMTHTVTLYLTDNITDYPITKITLPAGASWASDDQTGVNVGGAVTDGSKGDIVVSSGGDTWSIATGITGQGGAVTLAKMANLATDKLIGRDTAGDGAPEAIGVTGGIEFNGAGSIRVGAFSGDVGKTAGATTLTITDAAVTPAKLSATAQALSFRNVLINGGMDIDQRNAGASTSIANNVYCLDRWYMLTSTGNVSVSRQAIPSSSSNGIINHARLTAGATQKFGITQIVEAVNCQHLRGQSVVLNFSLRVNTGTPVIRYAILEWTGTADTLSTARDLISNWANSGTPTSSFFKSTTMNLLANGSQSASTSWASLSTPLTATVGSSANNLIVFIWTPADFAQSNDLDITNVQLERGTTATEFERVNYQVSLNQCRRYCLVLRQPTLRGVTQSSGFVGYTRLGVNFPVELRASPTVTMTGTITLFDGTDIHSSTAFNSSFVCPQSAELVIAVSGVIGGRPGLSYIDNANTAVVFFVAEM